MAACIPAHISGAKRKKEENISKWGISKAHQLLTLTFNTWDSKPNKADAILVGFLVKKQNEDWPRVLVQIPLRRYQYTVTRQKVQRIFHKTLVASRDTSSLHPYGVTPKPQKMLEASLLLSQICLAIRIICNYSSLPISLLEHN